MQHRNQNVTKATMCVLHCPWVTAHALWCNAGWWHDIIENSLTKWMDETSTSSGGPKQEEAELIN